MMANRSNELDPMAVGAHLKVPIEYRIPFIKAKKIMVLVYFVYHSIETISSSTYYV